MERLESMATSSSPLLSPILRSLIRLFESLIDVWSGIEKLKVSPEEELLGLSLQSQQKLARFKTDFTTRMADFLSTLEAAYPSITQCK